METDKIPQELPMAQAPIENEPIHKSLLNQKGSFLLILGAVVIILVVLGAGGYLLTMNKSSNSNQYAPQPIPTSSQPTPSNETANWKTYTDTKLNFSIEYPADVSISRTLPEGGVEFSLASELQKDFRERSISLNIYFRGDNVMPEEAQKIECAKPCADVAEKTTINNASGVKVASTSSERYYLNGSANGKVVGIFLTFPYAATSKSIQTNLIEFRKILSTFKFTDQTTDNTNNTNAYNANDVNNFPPYPGSVFINKEKHEPCPSGGAGGFAICDTVTYTWETKDDYDQVSSWYREDKSNSGWKCSGGAGSYVSSRDASGRTTCRKGNLVYSLDLSATAAKTQITLVISSK